MYNLVVRNVNQALPRGLRLLALKGVNIAPRGARTFEYPEPVATTYTKPWERVLFNATRDANPFFHLMESLWILDGRQDVAWIGEFNGSLKQFSDNGVIYHGAYGHRLRSGIDPYRHQDQLKEVVSLFKKDINTRRAVLQIWDSVYDLNNNDCKDIPCNDLIMLKVRNGCLNMTVCNRSNDIIWGAYGANAVQFSILQEYLAAQIGVSMGTYTQISDSYHVYPDNPQYEKLLVEYFGEYCFSTFDCCPILPEVKADLDGVYGLTDCNLVPLVIDPGLFDAELHQWMDSPADMDLAYSLENPFFERVATPMVKAWRAHKLDKTGLEHVCQIEASDWREACTTWLVRREHPEVKIFEAWK